MVNVKCDCDIDVSRLKYKCLMFIYRWVVIICYMLSFIVIVVRWRNFFRYYTFPVVWSASLRRYFVFHTSQKRKKEHFHVQAFGNEYDKTAGWMYAVLCNILCLMIDAYMSTYILRVQSSVMLWWWGGGKCCHINV